MTGSGTELAVVLQARELGQQREDILHSYAAIEDEDTARFVARLAK